MIIMAVLPPVFFSILWRPRITTEPRPVLAAESWPARPRIIPPVGKSGPGTILIISSIEISEEEKRAKVYLKPDQVSLAIGKGGNNIKLAGKLSGYELDVYREGEVDVDDVDLEEFADEIDSWIIDELKAIGCDTAKSVLEISIEDLVQRTDLEEETIEEVFKILRAEFE